MKGLIKFIKIISFLRHMFKHLYNLPRGHETQLSLPCPSLSSTKPTMTSSDSPTREVLEFRSSIDDAWYDVGVELNGDVLRVEYCDFPVEKAEVFDVNNFGSCKEVKEFEARFRPLSVQVQDSECSEALRSVRVCVSYSPIKEDVRFYDALIEEVDIQKHSFANGEEQCFCKFILFWLHGPSVGTVSPARIENICRIQSGPLKNIAVTSFLKRAEESIQIRLTGVHIDQDELSHNTRCKLDKKHDQPSSQCVNQNLINETARYPKNVVQPSGGIIRETEDKQDTDFGGMKYQHMILIENLEKDVSPLGIEGFLHEQTSVLSQVYVFPSLCSDLYARGAVILDCKKNLEKLCAFLDNPDQIIVSSKERPLIVVGKAVLRDTFGELKIGFIPKCYNQRGRACDELKILKSGTKEYNIAKEMKELIMEFIAHQRRLQQNLVMEETKILGPIYETVNEEDS